MRSLKLEVVRHLRISFALICSSNATSMHNRSVSAPGASAAASAASATARYERSASATAASAARKRACSLGGMAASSTSRSARAAACLGRSLSVAGTQLPEPQWLE